MSKPDIQKVATPEDRSLPVFAEFEKMAERIRQRTMDFIGARDPNDNSNLDSWLAAEPDIRWPAAELKEDKKGYKAKVALAGFDDDDISVTATPSELIVKAAHETKKPSAHEKEDETVRFSEFRSEEVYRQFCFPDAIDVDSVKAKFKRGMLTVSAKKAHREKDDASKKVSVQSAA